MATPGGGGGTRRQTRHGQGHGARVSLGFSASSAQSHPHCVQFPVQSGPVGVGVATRHDVRRHHRGLSFLVRRSLYALHLAV